MSVDYPIDAVITWVDGNDVNWQQKINDYAQVKINWEDKKETIRYNSIDEINIAISSIIKFAPFIRNIFLVTDNQVPNKFEELVDLSKAKGVNLQIVDHTVIFRDYNKFLPCFNSCSIISMLFRIPNLAEHFIIFNDDTFLINKTSPKDFFIDGFPVLRGKWLKFDEDLLYKKVKNIFFKKKEVKRVGHKIAQQKGAATIGFTNYYKFHHTPYPLRKSTFENFFSANKNIELENVRYKFRSSNQFTPQGLANHIEIQNKTCVLKEDYQMVYIQSYKKPLQWYKLQLKMANQKNKLFMCLQSLDQCPQHKLKYILNWLTRKFEN